MKTKLSFLNSPFTNVFLFSLFWALQIFISKIALNSGSEVVTLALQSSVIALVILGIYVLPEQFKVIRLIPKDLLKWILIANAVHAGIGSFLSYAGLSLTTAINTGFLSKFALVTTTF